MNRFIVVTAAFLTAVLLLIVSDANSENVNVISGAHYAAISNSRLLSGTMTLNKEGGVFKTLVDSGDVLALTPGETLVSSFKLPDNADHINVSIDFYASSDSAKGQIRWNGDLVSGEEFVLKKKNAQKAFSTVSFLLNGAQAQNELKIFSVEGEVCIHRIKIDYDYPIPFCEKHNVTVVLTSPVSNIDDVQQNIRLEWRIKNGDCRNGWISLQYEDNGVWKTVPGAELLDCQAKKRGEFIWKKHGLSAIPQFQIEYHDYKKDPLPKNFSREMRPFVLKKTDSLSDFSKLIDRLLHEDIELFNTIEFTYDKITEFIPAEETTEENLYHKFLKSRAARLSQSFTQGRLDKIEKLIEERKQKDLDVEYKLLDLETIYKYLNLFKTLERGIKYLSESTQKRIDDLNQYIPNRIEEETAKQKKVLEDIRDKIKEVQSIVSMKKKEYLSYSVVSPYLADADRALKWELPNYNKKIDMLYVMYKYRWIQNCSDDVEAQFSELLTKRSDTYPRIKKLKEDYQASLKKLKLKK